MKTFPMFLKVAGRAVVIVGDGEQAAQKARLMLKTEADLVLVPDAPEPELQNLLDTGRARRVDPATQDIFPGSALVFVATGCKGADAAWHARAKAAGAVVNVVDYPDLCDAMTPSIVDRDPVVVAIGTEGTAPLLGRRIKTQVEEMLHARLGDYAAMAGRLRAEVAHRVAARDRRQFWQWVFSGTPWAAFSSGRDREAARLIKDAIAGEQRDESGHLCVVHGAQDAGMIPMVAVQRMQEADILYADPGVPDSVLELARRDAERVRTNDGTDRRAAQGILRLCRNAAETQRVVCLTGGAEAWDLADCETEAEQILCAMMASAQGRSKQEVSTRAIA